MYYTEQERRRQWLSVRVVRHIPHQNPFPSIITNVFKSLGKDLPVITSYMVDFDNGFGEMIAKKLTADPNNPVTKDDVQKAY